ncbi:hypothetical protein RchiOBHm_Chr4g0411071 [Rosa chinensis]|uniref:Uncharacterized protein n=1 Tax=Rosa chinensis TaxID=74649 RepID=A0A2P6QVH9_ROSCH|nr:hypothetical protein RchiOBHm_Chr4g0411071 [Rosa chinensis]
MVVALKSNFLLFQNWNADNHSVHVLTRFRSKAELIVPGKKLGTFQES